MASTSLPDTNVVVFSPSFKEDIATGLSVNAETGVWFIFGAGLVLATLIIVISGLALAQNTNFPSDNLDDGIIWTSIAAVGIAAIALLVTPWLIFQSTIIATINFILFFLVLGLVVIALLAIAQTQQTDATESFETAIFWVSIVWIVVALLGAVGLGVLLWDLNRKQNPLPIPFETETTETTTVTRTITDEGKEQINTQSVVVTDSPQMNMSADSLEGLSSTDLSTGNSEVVLLSQEELDSLRSPNSVTPITKNGITIISDPNF